MECASEFHRLASHNKFVADLEKQGYNVDFVGGHLVIYGVPYVDEKGALRHGDLASPVDLGPDFVIDKPSSHQVWFRGDVPYAPDRRRVHLSAQPNPREIAPGFICQLSFSAKLEGGRNYESFEEKISTYLDLLTSPAVYSYAASPLRTIETKAAEFPSPLKYPDTMSGRDGINDLARKLGGIQVGIVGLGGTGSYILDFMAKTHVAALKLFDDDIVHVHTLFRMPGAVDRKWLGHKKVDVLYDIYSNFHDAIEPNATKITAQNTDLLAKLDFVFVAVDDAPARETICRALANLNIPFVDAGMGLYRTEGGLDGMIRIAGGSKSDESLLFGTPYLPSMNAVDNEYRRQPQLGELNAYNAALAVVRMKQSLGFFARQIQTSANVFEIGTFDFDHHPPRQE